MVVKKAPRFPGFFSWNSGVPRDVTKKVTEASEQMTKRWPKDFRKRKQVIELLLPTSPWFDLILTLSWPILIYSDHSAGRAWPILTYFDLFCRAGLTYFHRFRPTSFHDKAPWTGHFRRWRRPVPSPLSPYSSWFLAFFFSETSPRP